MSARWTDQDLADYQNRRVMQKRTTSPKVGAGREATREVESAPAKKNKYNARKTTIGDETFDSKKEAERWLVLQDRQSHGEIRNLTRQVRLPLEVDGFRICVYVCDYKYIEGGKTIHEDCKGMRTPVYLLKKKLVKAILKIEILET